MNADIRDLDKESQDNSTRSYSYDFDWIIRRYLLQRVSPHLDHEGSTLEIGAFKGDLTSQILTLFPNLSVLEGSNLLAGHLRRRFGSTVRIHELFVESANFASEFDTIFLVHTLEHIEDRVKVLSRVSTWLRDGGRLVVAVPNGHALSRRIAVAMGLIRTHCSITTGEWEHGHRITYSTDTLLADLLEAGLTIESRGGVLLKPLSNGQFDEALRAGVIDEPYLQALDALALDFPDLSASLYAVCRRSQ